MICDCCELVVLVLSVLVHHNPTSRGTTASHPCRSLQFDDGLDYSSAAAPMDETRRQFLLNAVSSLTAEVTEKIEV
jgi:hypothetical protein